MKTRAMVSAAALVVVLGLVACGPQAATPQAQSETKAQSFASVGDGGSDPRDAAIPQVDGKPMWSANRENTAEQNAQAAFDRNGEAFGAKTVDEFVQKAHDFTQNPGAGVKTIKRKNGDTLFYDAKSNVFAVMTKDGAPRTMFKPDDGPAYWQTQVERETARTKAADQEG